MRYTDSEFKRCWFCLLKIQYTLAYGFAPLYFLKMKRLQIQKQLLL